MKKVYIKPQAIACCLKDNLMDVITPATHKTDDFAKENNIEFDWDDDESIFKDLWAEDEEEEKELW